MGNSEILQLLTLFISSQTRVTTEQNRPATGSGGQGPWCLFVYDYVSSLEIAAVLQVFLMLCICLSHVPSPVIQLVTKRWCVFPEQRVQQVSQCGQSPSHNRMLSRSGRSCMKTHGGKSYRRMPKDPRDAVG